MTLGAIKCGQCVGLVSMVTGSCGCDQWVGPVNVVSGDGYTVYHIMMYSYSCLSFFDNRIPTFSSIFVNYFPFLFLFNFLDFSNLIRERLILGLLLHLRVTKYAESANFLNI